MSTPSKAQDPAAAALSAIEDALRLNLDPEASATPAPAQQSPEQPAKLDFHLPTPRSEARLDDLASPPRMPEVAPDELAPVSRQPEAARAPSSPRAANDDLPSVGQILQTLQSRPDSSAMTLAIIGSAPGSASGSAISSSPMARPSPARCSPRARRSPLSP